MYDCFRAVDAAGRLEEGDQVVEDSAPLESESSIVGALACVPYQSFVGLGRPAGG